MDPRPKRQVGVSRGAHLGPARKAGGEFLEHSAGCTAEKSPLGALFARGERNKRAQKSNSKGRQSVMNIYIYIYIYIYWGHSRNTELRALRNE